MNIFGTYYEWEIHVPYVTLQCWYAVFNLKKEEEEEEERIKRMIESI